MMWVPYVEGEFVCCHLARNLADLVLVLTGHKKIHRTVMTLLGGSGHNNTLLSYLSCKGCFESVSAAMVRDAGQERPEPDHRYRITGSVVNHGRGSRAYSRVISGSCWYALVRRRVPFRVGSGYKFDRERAQEIWEDAWKGAFADWLESGGSDLSGHQRERQHDRNRTNTSEKTWTTRLARTRLPEAIEAIGDEGMPHRPFDRYRLLCGGKACEGCYVAFDGRGRRCRFCRNLTRSEVKRLEGLGKKIMKRLYRPERGGDDRRDELSKRIEDDGKTVLVSEMVEERGKNETFSELREVYGRREACELLGISADEAEDHEGLSGGEREDLEGLTPGDRGISGEEDESMEGLSDYERYEMDEDLSEEEREEIERNSR